MDNDGDGKVDFPYDPGCSAPNEDSEADMCPDGAGCPQCADGIDNDNNGKIDFPDDPGCATAADPIEFTDDPNACGQGLVIKPLPQNGIDSGMLTGTTSSVSSPCGGGNGLPAIAYIFHLTKPRVMIASTDDSATAIDTVLDLRSSMCTMPDAELTCHDDINPGSSSTANTKSKLVRALPPGTYYLIVGGKTAGDTGMYSLSVSFLAGEGSACDTTDDCGPGLVCRVPAGESAMVCTGPVCNDGRDDDADGIIDYPNDPGCATPTDDTEDDTCATNPQDPGCPECSNGLDDNGNGDIDYPNEANCLAAGSTSEACVQSESIEQITQPVTTGTTIGAVNDFKPSCNTSNTAPDVVYRLDLPVKMSMLQLEIDGFDAIHALLSSTCENPSIACSDPDVMTRSNVAAGTYYVVVDGYSANSGNFTLTTSGTIAPGQSCEGPLAQSGAFTCGAGSICGGMPGSRTCVPVPCDDGIDNDGDGKTDFPADPGCSSKADADEADDCYPTPGPSCPACADGMDNDGDGATDYPQDLTCTSASGTNEQCAQSEAIGTITQAVTTGTTAGAVNDFKPTCGGSSHSAPDLAYRIEVPAMATLSFNVTGFDTAHVLLNSTCGGTAIACSDPPLMSRTNVAAGAYYLVIDGYGSASGAFTLTTSGTVKPGESCEGALFQSGAFTCTAGYACGGTTGSRTCVKTGCNDGIDNDGDGKADAADPGCASPSDNDETDDCSPVAGPSCPVCGDGVDNDGDGKTDFPSDTSCARASSNSEACTQSESVEMITQAITTGTTAGAGNEFTPSCGSSSHSAPDLIYRLDVPAMATLNLNVTGFDTAHVLLDSTCGGTEIACSDPSLMARTDLAAGTYYVVVDGWGSGSGAFTLTTSGTVKPGGSCEGALFQSGAFTCTAGHACGGTPGSRTCVIAGCNDGIDNDGDGKADIADPGCASSSDDDETDDCGPPAGPNCPKCSDGVDNDGDGDIDYPADPNCTRASGSTETCAQSEPTLTLTMPQTMGTTATAINDVILSCASSTNTAPDISYRLDLPAMASLTITATTSFDAAVALHDATCGGTAVSCVDKQISPPEVLTVTNLIAGSYYYTVDGYSSGSGSYTLTVSGTIQSGGSCEEPLAQSGAIVCPPQHACAGPAGMRRCLGQYACNDGMDNDGDGKIDYPVEPGCTSPSDNDEADACFPTPGPGCPQCGNGIDDDLDMKTDFGMDPQCPNASYFHENFCSKEIQADVMGLITSPTTTDTLAGRNDNFDQSCQSNTGNDVTYGLRLPVAVEKLEIDTLGSPQDTVLSLWNGTCSTEIECDDDGGGGLKSRIKRNNVPPGDYAIQVDVYNASANNTTFTLNVKGTVAPGTWCTDPMFASGVLVCRAGTSCTGGICQ